MLVSTREKFSTWKHVLVGSLAALALGGCDPVKTEPEAPDAGSTEIGGLPEKINIRQLTNTSADEYSLNRWGLIEAATLGIYANTWTQADTAPNTAVPNGRPAHLQSDARLIVLQLNKANRAPGEDYVPSRPDANVHVYEIDAFRFNETRDTGLISNSVRYQASGPTTDAWLARYGIRPQKDFIVFAAGENTGTNGSFFQELTRAIYWLSYWGVDLKNLAIVNGTLGKNYTQTLVSNKVSEGTFSNDGFTVKSLRRDHTALTLPLEDFLKIVDEQLKAKEVVQGFEEQFIIDARPSAQFNRTTPDAAFASTHPGQFITTAWNSAGAPSQNEEGQKKNYVLVEGHVKGAVTFPWANLLVNEGNNNWKYKTRSELVQIFAWAGYAANDAAKKVVVSQCRTNFEVQVNGFASRVILGYPTVHFDGSLVEYLSLVSNHPVAEFNLKPEDPAYRFRTDLPTRVQHFEASANAEAPSTTKNDAGVPAYNVPTLPLSTAPGDRKVAQAQINRNATTTRKALDEDREFKRIPSN